MLKITKNQGSIQVTADQSGFYPFDGTLTFPTNSLFTCAQNNTDMITFKSTSNGDVQFVGNYKDITISGRSYDTKQKFLTAFSNLANQGSVDAYTKAETDAKIDAKQGKLKAGNGITLTEDATDGTTVVKTAVSLTDNGEGAYQVGDSIEIGDGIAIGSGATSPSAKSIAIGKSANINSDDIESVAIGYKANAAESYSVAIGSNTTASQSYDVSVGYKCASQSNSVAIGKNAYAVGGSAVAIGNNATADSISNGSIAIGYIADARGMSTVAIGASAIASDTTPLAINAGYKTVDGRRREIKMIQGDANGKISLLKGDGTDERIVIQDEIEALKNAGGGGSVDAYTKAETDTKLDAKQDKLTAGSGITITKDETAGTSTIATAVSLTDNGNGAYQVGDSIKMGGNVIAIGSKANIKNGNKSVVIGNDTTTNYGCVTIGYNAAATKSFSTVIGNYATSYGSNGIAVGNGASTNENSSWCIAIGKNAQGEGYSTVSIGSEARANKNKPLVINAGSKTDDGNNSPLTVLQSDATGKISVLLGDGTDTRMVIQDEIEALKNAGGGGSVEGLVIDANKVAAGLEQTSFTNRKSVVIGNQAEAYAEYLVLIGQGAKCWGDDGVVIGNRAESTVNGAVGSVVIGADAKSSAEYGVSIGRYAEANNTTPLVINAGVNGNSMRLTMIQGDSNGKISLLKGDGTDERMVIQDEIAALKAEIAALKGGASTGDTTGA